MIKLTIEIPDNATNGDVCKALFPADTYTICETDLDKGAVYRNGYICGYLDWWNAPYDRLPDKKSN